MLTTEMCSLSFGHPRHQAADAADVELDFHAGVGRAIQGLDDFRIDERVELGDDPRFLAVVLPVGLRVDHLDDSFAQAERSGVDFAKSLRLRESGNGIEERDRIRTEILVACHQADVAIQAAGDLVVVARAEVDVTHDAVRARGGR